MLTETAWENEAVRAGRKGLLVTLLLTLPFHLSTQFQSEEVPACFTQAPT